MEQKKFNVLLRDFNKKKPTFYDVLPYFRREWKERPYNWDKDYKNVPVKTKEELKKSLQGVLLYYELSEPVEDIFEKPLNLTYTVINGGTETSLATENSTQFEGSIAYNKDYVAVVDELQMQNRVTTIEFENWEK